MSAHITYGPDRSRWIEQAEEGTWQYTRHYAGAGFEVLTWGTGNRVDTHYIFANGRAVAQWTTSNVEPDRLQYLHRDHQGSVVATTDDAGVLIAEYEYDAFGKRTVVSGSEEDSRRGYTGHEHLAPVELIHMNGRVQDPVIGRFLSADPLVQAPYLWRQSNDHSGHCSAIGYRQRKQNTVLRHTEWVGHHSAIQRLARDKGSVHCRVLRG